MPEISDRGKTMPESPIRKLVPFAEEAKRKGHKVYHLNIGQPDIKTPEIAIEAVKNLKQKVIEYSHSAGNESYRRKLSGYYKGIGIDVDHTEMLITTGGSEAILLALLSTLNPGDEIIIPEPFYANYNGFTVSAGVNIVPITSEIENGNEAALQMAYSQGYTQIEDQKYMEYYKSRMHMASSTVPM